ncbi:MAG: hypothetical protein ACRDOI_43965 [Trebonia sp.]
MARPLAAAQASHDRHQQERQRAAAIAERYPGWTLWATRDGNARVATRSPRTTDPGDGTWAATLICDNWTQLEKELAAQAQHDAERTYQ